VKKLSLYWAAALLGFAALPASADDNQHCSLETLHGTMAYATITYRQGVQISSSGQESYDGKGHMTYYEFQSDGGVPQTYSGTGTYTITANCVATVTYDAGAPWVYFVSADGEHYYWNNNQDNGAISAGRADRVSKALLVP